MNVLSLCDGGACGRVALERAGVKVDTYFASEISSQAMTIAINNYPDIIQLGDLRAWKTWEIDWGSIDLLTCGFPCQSWSVAGKQRGLQDPRGSLVHDIINIWNHIKSLNPNLKVLFENVKMKKEFLDQVTTLFGIEPILINSALVSAQNRKRYYWTNIPNTGQPEDLGILLKDIVHENTDTPDSSYLDKYKVPFDKSLVILSKEVEAGKVGYFRQDSQANRVYYIHGKAVTLTGESGGGAAKMGAYLFGCITPDRVNKRQRGQRFNEGEKFYTLTDQDRHGILIEGYIRKLTPIECCRLQNLPDNYTAGVSETQQYKMLGNGWTVGVIAHLFKNL